MVHPESIFAEAIEITAAQDRAQFLEEACLDDPTLRQEVERLVADHFRAGRFLESPVAQLVAPGIPQVPLEQPGELIGPYKLLEQLGEGGMGVVYLAEQLEPVRRRVALKIIKPGMDTRQVIARFEAERQALAMMDHPNIAKVLDAGTTQSGRPFFVMELVQGIPITRYCDEQKLSLKQRLELFVPVCQALQHAHQKGVIHRDLKPSNVLVADYDSWAVPKVIDFGIAKATGPALTEPTMFTQLGQVVGTLEYMSPEQARLNQLDIDTRSDIYSLGVLLYELLTGSTPFDQQRLRTAAFDEVLRIIREEDPPKPSTRLSSAVLPTGAAQRHPDPTRLSRQVRGELDWIVMKALDKDRNRRYETANGFALDLQRYLANEPVVACPPSSAYRLRKFVQRNRLPVGAAALILLALVGGVIGTTWGLFRATSARAVAERETREKSAAFRQAENQLWLSLYERARAGRFSRRMGQRLESLDALTKAARIRPDGRLRDEAIAAMALPDVRRTAGWPAAPPALPARAYGRQYRLYARMDEPKVISIRTIPDDQEVRRIESGEVLGTYLHFSPDDRHLLALQEGYVLGVWRVADGKPALQSVLRCRAHAFSPDGKQLAVGQPGKVLIFDLDTGEEVNRWSVPAAAHTMAFHPDNRQVAVGFFETSAVSVYNSQSGGLVADLPVGGMTNHVVAWHPQGELLAVAGSDPRIQIWHVGTKRKVATLEGHVQHVPDLTFHPDGDLLASHGWDGMLLLWNHSAGRQLMRLTSIGAPRFSADGRWLGAAWNDRGADLLEVAPAREYRTLVCSAGTSAGGFNHGDISPDGRLLAVAMNAGCRVWDLASGRELAMLPSGTLYVCFNEPMADEVGPRPSNRPNWSLITSGSAGLMRWDVTTDDPQGRRLRLGPPWQISPLKRAWFARGKDGQALGVATEEGGVNQLLDLQTGEVRRDLGNHPQAEVRALSPDGRWAASSGWHSDQVHLISTETAEVVHKWNVGKRTYTFFTPDSRLLVIARDNEFSLWDVETRQPILRLPREVAQLPGHVAFSADGQLMALEMAPSVIHLKEVATGRTVARLEDPHGDRAAWMGFTPDNTRLVVTASYASAVHIWDLRAVRARLKGISLDWDWPEFETAPSQTQIPEPITIEVVPAQSGKPP